MGDSTPIRFADRGRRSLFQTPAVASPLRRSTVAINSSTLLEPADDEAERSNRRSMVAMQKRLTSITSTNMSPLVDVAPVMEESQMKDHLRICAKLYTENRISAKNAWQLHVIDVMRKIASTESANVLQVAGSSLDIGTKVYSLRVDDVHARGLQLASSMSNRDQNSQAQEAGGELDPDVSLSHNPKRRNALRKNKKMAADKRNTVDKEQKNLFGSIKHIESVVFQTKENIDVSATDNLFTQRLPINPSNHQFMLLSEDKYWSNEEDTVLNNGEKLLDIELPSVSHYNLCPAFKEFEIGTWDPEEEERLLNEAAHVPEPILDDNGLPVAELDGSVHDIFEENDVPEDQASDVEEQEVFQAQIHGEVAHIVDAVPEENRVETEYGYNTLVRTVTGKYIDKIWAGPSHWKVKFNRRSSARFSGTTVQKVTKYTRKAKVPQKIDFTLLGQNLPELVGKYVCKRAPPTTTLEKITLPVPELPFQNFHTITDELLTKPGVRRPQLNTAPQEMRDCEVPVYNYENPNDSNYCSQNNDDDANDDEPMAHSFEEHASPVAQQQFLGENLVSAPEMVSATYVPYAMQAKKMDMKKLKSAIWKYLSNNLAGVQGPDKLTAEKITFSQLYQNLPQLLTAEMKKELTCPLALVALLHICNENNLILTNTKNYKDFTIEKFQK